RPGSPAPMLQIPSGEALHGERNAPMRSRETRHSVDREVDAPSRVVPPRTGARRRAPANVMSRGPDENPPPRPPEYHARSTETMIMPPESTIPPGRQIAKDIQGFQFAFDFWRTQRNSPDNS